jgi:hypothetical protein
MQACIASQRHWLMVEPACLRARPQPGGGLWSSLKAVELANLTFPTLGEVIDQPHRGIERIRHTRV